MRIYGVGEIAQELHVDVDLVRKWRERGRMPEPTAKLTMGYVWQGQEIEDWMNERAELTLRPVS